jgi:hypothetical protein
MNCSKMITSSNFCARIISSYNIECTCIVAAFSFEYVHLFGCVVSICIAVMCAHIKIFPRMNAFANLILRRKRLGTILFNVNFDFFIVLFGGSKVYLSTVPFRSFDILQSVCVYLGILGYPLGTDSNTRDFFHSFHDTCWWNIPITCPNPLVHVTCFSP